MTTETAVGERVRRLREAKGLSLRDLARSTGVSAPMLSQVERGETSPTLQVATKIATGLELTLSQLLRLDEIPHATSSGGPPAGAPPGTGTPSTSSRRHCPASPIASPSTRCVPAR